MWVTSESYRIAAKFGGENVWQIYSFQAFGEKSLANGSAKWLLIVTITLDGYYFGWF